MFGSAEPWKTARATAISASRPACAARARLIGAAHGKQFFDAFRGQIGTFVEREQVLIKKRQEAHDQAVASVLNNLQTIENTAQWVDHTYKVIAQAQQILAAAIDMETGMRGFLLAGKENFLEPYNGGRTQFYENIRALKVTVSDNPAQVALLGEIQETIDGWQQQVTEPAINLRRDIAEGRGYQTMQDIAELVDYIVTNTQ